MTFQPPAEELLEKAAELRASGASWEAVAAAVGRAAETVKRWPRLYQKKWEHLLSKAEKQQLREATAESLHTLRRQLRLPDDKASRDAAQKVMQFRLAVAKSVNTKSAGKKPTTTRFSRICAYLESLDDEQLSHLLEDLLRPGEHAAAAGPLEPGAKGPPAAESLS